MDAIILGMFFVVGIKQYNGQTIPWRDNNSAQIYRLNEIFWLVDSRDTVHFINAVLV